MAIQLPNPGLGDGQTGDNEYVMWTKVKDNFSNSAHAASKIVGTANNQIPLAQHTFEAAFSRVTSGAGNSFNANNFASGTARLVTPETINIPLGISSGGVCYTYSAHTTADVKVQIVYSYINGTLYTRGLLNGNPSTTWNKYYHTGNTQSDTSTNGYIKPSSPIIMLHGDSITTNDDGEKMGAALKKHGTGDYEITGTTGLRSEGWYIEIPNDLHGNPMVAVTLEEKDGTLKLKSFKRVFNMQTFKFEPDLNSPMDIPKGRWIDLRFNDLPQEELDETIE